MQMHYAAGTMLDVPVLSKASRFAIRPSIKYGLVRGHERDIYIVHLDTLTRQLHSTALPNSTLPLHRASCFILRASCLVLGFRANWTERGAGGESAPQFRIISIKSAFSLPSPSTFLYFLCILYPRSPCRHVCPWQRGLA